MRESHALNGTRGLVVVTRAPGSDGAKTRLAQAIGQHACERLQGAFLDDTLAWAAPLAGRGILSVYPPAGVADVAARADGWVVAPQVGEEFGERMRRAVNAGFAAGAAPVAMIASDSPTLPPEILEEGWDAVSGDRFDVALAPADDGGWVMIATARPLPPDCFAGVGWSAADTLDDTRRALAGAGLRVGCTRPWYDVDTEADLERLRSELAGGAARRLPRTAAAVKPFLG
jgi:rSAM/selenodomain-associated transferase 1